MSHRAGLWHRDEGGATAVEYAMITAAITAVIILVVIVLGNQTQEGFCGAASALEAAGAQNNPNC